MSKPKVSLRILALLYCASTALLAVELPRDIIAFWPSKQFNMQPLAISTARVVVRSKTPVHYTGEDFGSVWGKIAGGNVHVVLSMDISMRLREEIRTVNLKSIKCEVQPTEYPVTDYLCAYKGLLEGIMKMKMRYQPLPMGVSVARGVINMHGRDSVYLLIAPMAEELNGDPQTAIFESVAHGSLKKYEGLKPLEALTKRWLDSGAKAAPEVSYDARIDASIIRSEYNVAEDFFRDFGSP